ncbi:MAG: acetyl-CoA carboxylase, biotin carboxyl carrier protein [Coriobacteriales bacterium]|jgi:acetyl-CoA carboxylase biotin carboxyl carrier protein|nr:acetyl-CoA carboxylase, biotin carboxyl carrier protein [Coriobacteriales bacterium]
MTVELEQLAALLDAHSLTRLEYEQGDLRVVMERTPKDAGAASGIAPCATPAASPATSYDVQTEQASSATTPDGRATLAPDSPVGTTVTAPLVGVVYRSREPDTAAFVECGQQVVEGEVLCLIEAMKLFNEITAPCSGTIGAVLFEDATLVEYGAPLITILPNGT